MRTERYRYRAVYPDGRVEQGAVEALTREAAATLVSDRGLFPLEVAHAPEQVNRGNTLPARDLALGLRVLANLLEAEMPMSRALGAFEELAPASWTPGMAQLRDDVREGHSLASALSRSSLAFPALVIGIIQAGESGSGLAAAVRASAELTEASAATRAAIRAVLVYPVILAVAGVASVWLLVGIVLPRFAAILADLGQTLPASTRLVLTAASVARVAALPAGVVAVVLLLLWRRWTTTDDGVRRWHGWLLSTPVIGSIRFATGTARACAATGALLRSGVPVASALQHAARASGDAALGARLLVARGEVVTGQRIGRAIAESAALTPTAVRLVRAGEETGRLAEMFEHAARIERDRAQEATRSAVQMLEPAIILVFGGVVALIAAALLQAVYSVRPGA
jgi:general secretion pathway protein F